MYKSSLLILLVFSIGLNVFQYQKLDKFKSGNDREKKRGSLQLGDTVPTISATQLDGSLSKIQYSDSDLPTVLYMFAPKCSWCQHNLSSLRSFSGQIKNKANLIGISLAYVGTNEYIQENPLPFQVLKDIPADVFELMKLGSTPQTIVISPEGKVLKSWIGAYMGNTKSEIESYFDVQLPEIKLER